MKRGSFLKKLVASLAVPVFACGLTGCGRSETGNEAGSGKPRVVATTTMLADLVSAIAGDDAEVIGLMEPGVDPHTYELPSRAITQIRNADVLIYNGLLLEGKLDEVLEPLKEQGRAVVAVGEALPKEKLLTAEDFEGHGDPHVWGDAELWQGVIPPVVAALKKAMPEKGDAFDARAAEYRKEIQMLHEWIQSRMAEVPEAHRTLVTSHDAFNYFGNAYGFEVIGVQGISTATEAGLADIVAMVDLIKERGVKSIFVESSVDPSTIDRISKDAGVTIGGELFSDSCGSAGEMKTVNGETYDVGTYIGMMKHNVNTVVEALK